MLAFSSNSPTVKQPLYMADTGDSSGGMKTGQNDKKTQSEKSKLLNSLIAGAKDNNIVNVNSLLSSATDFSLSDNYDMRLAIADLKENKKGLDNLAAARYAGKDVDYSTREVKSSTDTSKYDESSEISKLTGTELDNAISERFSYTAAKQLKETDSENVERLLLETVKENKGNISNEQLLEAMGSDKYAEGYKTLSEDDKKKSDGFKEWLTNAVNAVKDTVGSAAKSVGKFLGLTKD